MGFRPFSREQVWMFPPTLDEVLPADHPARYVGAFVDALDRGTWAELEVALEHEGPGGPPYHPRALLGVWLYGFMIGIRSNRKLERACRDQVPFMWLTGFQRPDHNSLWRFYRDHRPKMRELLKQTVHTAVAAGLVDLALQAVDGTKVGANAAKDRTLDAAAVESLLHRLEEAIADLEAQNEEESGSPAPRLPQALAERSRLMEAVKAAKRRVEAEGLERTNLTDPDAGLVKGRNGVFAGYNAQVMVSPIRAAQGARGLLITAADVVQAASDTEQLAPMLEQAEEMTGTKAAVTLADAGYHSGEALEACAERQQTVVMPEVQDRRLQSPYHKDRFPYDPQTDTYACPQGHVLRFSTEKRRSDEPGPVRVYALAPATCRACPAFGVCTKSWRHGRTLEVGPHDALLRAHRAWMRTPHAQALFRLRKVLPEPCFGMLKEQQAGRRFLLRGLPNVRGEWWLLATARNLRSLWRFLWARAPSRSTPRTASAWA